MAKEEITVSEAKFTKEEAESGKLMGILSYLGILCLIPYLTEKENKFVMYHAKQGLNLFLIGLIAGAISGFSCIILIGFLLAPLVSVCICVLAIIGIVNVCNGEAKDLPVIDKFKLIK